MSTAPRVTVLMPAYNREAYIGDSIASVLSQTYGDFELLVIDDHSQDHTAAIAESFGDSRIRVVRHPENMGIPYTRNEGMRLARGEFVAMLDSDDMARPRRLEKQLRFLDRHPDHAMVGSWAHRISAKGKRKRILSRPRTHDRILARLLFMGCFRTPSMTGRREILSRYEFRKEFPVCSDSDFWVRIALEHKGANLPEILIDYRMHKGSVTKERRDLVRERKLAVSAYQLERLGMRFTQADLNNHWRLRRPERAKIDDAYLDWCRAWLIRLLEANQEVRLYPEPHFRMAVGERWREVLVRRFARRTGPPTRYFFDAELGRALAEGALQRRRLTLRYGLPKA